jgi:hypothetical protein
MMDCASASEKTVDPSFSFTPLIVALSFFSTACTNTGNDKVSISSSALGTRDVRQLIASLMTEQPDGEYAL